MQTKNIVTNQDRFLVSALKEICQKREIKGTFYSSDWIISLEKDSKHAFIYGYNFDLNSSSSSFISQDKGATSDVLRSNGIPNIEHDFFLPPELLCFSSKTNGNWTRIIKLVEKYGFPLVLKDNSGTSGDSVFKVNSYLELENAALSIFSTGRGLAISNYEEIISEYRVVLLDNTPQLLYQKCIPTITGDGTHTILELIAQNDLTLDACAELAIAPNTIPASGEQIKLGWKSNLSKGAQPKTEGIPLELQAELKQLAINSCQALNLSFCSVDIVKTSNDLKVLEVNCGIMLENFAILSEENREKAVEIYEKAVCKMLEIKFDN